VVELSYDLATMALERQTSMDSMEHATQEDPEAYHPPLPPVFVSQSLFLAGLTSISSDTLRKNNSGTGSSSVSLNTTATDDFVSAAGTMDDLDQFAFDEDDLTARAQHFTIPELDSITYDEENNEMPSTKEATVKEDPTPFLQKGPAVIAATPTEPAESHLDAAANVYEGAKGIWAWGKSVPVFSPFMGFTEAVAGKALETVAGTNLQDLDGNIKPQLKGFDSGILNPAVETVAGMMLGAAGKVEQIFKPIFVLVLYPFKMLGQQPANETPEVTTEATN